MSLSRLTLAAPALCCLILLPGCRQIFHAAATSSTDATVSTASVPVSGVAVSDERSPQNAPAATTTVPATAAAPVAANGNTLDDLTPLGLPIYPIVFERGWTDAQGLGLAALPGVKMDTKGMRVAQMTTHDSFDAVYAWYHDRMPAGSETAGDAASNHTNGDGDRGAQFEIGTAGEPNYQRVLIFGKTGDDTTVSLAGHVNS